MDLYMRMEMDAFQSKIESMTLDQLEECCQFFKWKLDEVIKSDEELAREIRGKQLKFLKDLQRRILEQMWNTEFKDSCDEQSEMDEYLKKFSDDHIAILELNSLKLRHNTCTDLFNLILQLSSACNLLHSHLIEKQQESTNNIFFVIGRWDVVNDEIRQRQIRQRQNSIVNDESESDNDN